MQAGGEKSPKATSLGGREGGDKKRKRQSPMQAARGQCGRMGIIHKDGKYGFIDGADGTSIFVLPSSCPNKVFPQLNDQVWYDIVLDRTSKRFRADKVRSSKENDEIDARKNDKKEMKPRDPVFLRGKVSDINYRRRTGHIEANGKFYRFFNPLIRGAQPVSHDRVWFKPSEEQGTLWTDELEVIEADSGDDERYWEEKENDLGEEEVAVTKDPYAEVAADAVAADDSSEAESWPMNESIVEHVAKEFGKPEWEVSMLRKSLQKAELEFEHALRKEKKRGIFGKPEEAEEVVAKKEDEAQQIADSESEQ